MVEEEPWEISDRSFQAYGKTLENEMAFKYLGRVMTAEYDDWPEVAGNLQNLRKSWGRISRILSQEGADTKVLGQLFKAVLQVMFIFRVETWVPNPLMVRSLGIFQSRVARRLTGRHLWRQGDGSWDYPTMAAAIAEAVFEEIGV